MKSYLIGTGGLLTVVGMTFVDSDGLVHTISFAMVCVGLVMMLIGNLAFEDDK